MKQATPTQVRIPGQFNGPRTTGHGGYVAGMVGHRLCKQLHCGAPVRVDLRTPPPLDHDLAWTDGRLAIELVDDGTVVATGEPGRFADGVDPIPPVPLAAARSGAARFAGLVEHPFPTCFACGTERAEGEGLRLFTGPVHDDRVAGTWTPHPAFCDPDGRAAPEICWAALDCPGGWAAGIGSTPMVLGRMTAELNSRPLEGELCVVVGALRDVSGRKHHTATTIYGADGDIVGRAEQIWIAIDLEDFS